MRKHADFSGRRKQQARSQHTIAVLFEAVAQFLSANAPERLTTNHIADRAGYSIGTLYRYFPDKWALARAMADHETSVQRAQIEEIARTALPSASAKRIVRMVIRAALRPFAGRHLVHAGHLRLLMLGPASSRELALMTPSLPASLIEHLSGTICMTPSDCRYTSLFTATNAVAGAIRAAALTRPELLQLPEFEDDLVCIVLTSLRRGPGPAEICRA